MKRNRPIKEESDVSWEVLESKDILVVESRLAVSVQRLRLPNGKIVDDYHKISVPDAVVIVARTVENKIVMSRQYRHGLARVSLVFPAGTVEKQEPPLEAAKRELLEETGYSSVRWQSLGGYILHANYGCGRIHFFLAINAEQTAKPISSESDLEKMEIFLVDEQEVDNFIKEEKILSVGSITAWSLANLKKDTTC